ncbi:MAG: efflux RND transporter permease subunit [Acidobacteriota bacterium]|nr:efflux RND transporter permease subunit [Acidobacteriota bacterium]
MPGRSRSTSSPPVQRPTVALLVSQPGASSVDVAAYVVRPLERACHTVSGVRRVTSVSKDEFGAITVEFEYDKPIQEAVTDVMAAVDQVRAQLPDDVLEPQLFKIGDFTVPVMTLAVGPATDAGLDLALVRQIADNELKDALLNIPEVSGVEVFGGSRREISIQVDPGRMAALGLPFSALLDALREGNRDVPDGFLINEDTQIVIKTRGAVENHRQLEELPITFGGRVVRLRDVATVRSSTSDATSVFHFNGKATVAIHILRHEKANTAATIKAVDEALPALATRFPQLSLQVADSQSRIIDQSIANLKGSLRDAILFTIVVIFLMIADARSALITGISIPFTYFLTFSAMLLLGMEFNIVTMTGVILAVGMLVDDAIVVLENIERHYEEKGGDLRVVARQATREILQADFSGTFSTVIVLVPIMLLGGYVQKVMQPLTTVLAIALTSSFVVSVTIIPLIAPWIIRNSDRRENPILAFINALARRFQSVFVDRSRDFFSAAFATVNRHRIVFLGLIVILLPLSLGLMKIIGRDLMPPMDTGIVMLHVETETDYSIARSEKLLRKIEGIVARQEGLISHLAYIGAEPSLVSFGRGRSAQQIDITINLVDRFHRARSIWAVEDELRRAVLSLPGVKSVEVTEFGATPLSSIASTVDVQIRGDDFRELARLAAEVTRRLRERPGFTSVDPTWSVDRAEYHLIFDRDACAQQGLTPVDVSYQVALAARGVPAGSLRVFNQDGLRIRLRIDPLTRENMARLLSLPIQAPGGAQVPLRSLARIEKNFVPSTITREGLAYTVNIHGLRARAPVSFLDSQRRAALEGLELPAGFSLREQGEMRQMNESFGRLGKALALSLLFLYLTFVVIFRSFLDPVVIMLSIPFAAIGGIWALLIADRHGCMPAFMGFILLTGVIVNNAILLVDFIRLYRRQGHGLEEAVHMAIRVRTRPILMTAVTTIVGMVPIAAEWAIGLERLSPLAVVAIGGLLAGTILTLVYIPTLYVIKEQWIAGFTSRRGDAPSS